MVKDDLDKIKKEAQTLKKRLLLSKTWLHDVKEETDAFKNNSEKYKETRFDDIVVKLQKNNNHVNRMKVRSERFNKKFGDSTRISTLQKIKDETKKIYEWSWKIHK